jgi:hypothetical protein
MSGITKEYGELELKQAPARFQDAVIATVDGVRIYARTHPEGPPTLNGTHEDPEPIEQIAERLHALGYAVKIERFPLGPVIQHDFEAVWAGEGEPPASPFA